MKKRPIFLTCWALLSVIVTGPDLCGAADPEMLTGQVVDRFTGKPLVGVNVVVVGTRLGDATNLNGHFSIPKLKPGNYTLLVSAIGHEDVQLPIGIPQSEPLKVPLRETFFQMNEVVVTGTRTEKIYRESPVATEVITRQDILDSGARDIGELLAQRSGVSVGVGVEGGQVVNLLGIDAKYILVLVDGQPLSGKFNSRINLDQISTATVDKIEIVKGPSSAVYGSEAMGGVINIITSRKISRAPLIFTTRYSGSAAALNTASNLENPFNLDDGVRDVRLNLDQSWRSFRLQVDMDALWANVGKAMEFIDIDQYNKLTLRSQLMWDLSTAHTFDLRFSRFDTDEKSLLETTRAVTASTKIRRTTVTALYDWKVNNFWTFNTTGRWEGYMRDYNTPDPAGDNLTIEDEKELELHLIRASENLSFNTGLEMINSVYKNDRVSGGIRKQNAAGYHMQLDWQAIEDVTMILGSRVDLNDEIDPVFSPRIAAMYRLDERWKLRASWGQGFSMPSFMNRYIAWHHSSIGYTIVGNPDLKPETSQGYNLGLEYYHPEEYLITVMFYHNRFNDMIEDYLVPIGTRVNDFEVISPATFSYQNIERARLLGFEIQGRWNVSSKWLASWGYNFVDNRDLSTDELLPNTQPHSATVRFSHRHAGGNFSYALKTKFVAPYHPTGYDPFQEKFVRAEKQFSPRPMVDYDIKFRFPKNIKLAVGIHNLLDFTNFEFGPFTGRTYYIELETELNKGY